MKGKTVFKILLDIVMTILYLLLTFASGMDDFFHEVVGIAIGVLFITHVAVNFKPLLGMFRAMKSGKANAKTVTMLVLNLLLIIGMPIVIATGILISKVLFFAGISPAWMLIYNIHKLSTYVCLGVLGLHLIFHAKYLVNAFKGIGKNLSSAPVKKVIGRFTAGTFAAAFVYMLAFQMYKISTSSVLEVEQTSDAVSAELTEEITDSAASSIVVFGTTIDTEDESGEITAASADEESTAETSIDTVAAETTAAAAVETLNEFLSKMYCTLCHNHCPLSNPRCGKSASLIADATNEYNELYSI